MKASLVLFLFGAVAMAAPSFETVKSDYRGSEGRLLDRYGEVIHELRVDSEGRRLDWVALGDVSTIMRDTIVRAEDKRFYSHGGVDWLASLSALWGRILHRRARGASTLSMQVAAFLDRGIKPRRGRRTSWQKLSQMRQAWALERGWTKAQILEAYLNLVTFRGELRGIGAAARGIFGKDASGLSADEALILSSLVRSPNAPVAEIESAACRLSARLAVPVDCGVVHTVARDRLGVSPNIKPAVAEAPHVARILLRERGKGKLASARSTLDGGLQRFAANTLRRQLLAVRDQNVKDGAVLVVSNATGEVLAYVGNAGALASESFVDAIPAKRQAGSTLKPFLYALAFERKFLTPASLIDDSPLDVSVTRGVYRPGNYDNQFHGMVTARVALASSLNVPAVKTLLLVSSDAFVRRLRDLGFAGLETGDFYGPSLALGTADVSLWDLTNGFRTLANDGVSSQMRLSPDETAGATKRVYSREAAYLVSDILSDRESRSLTFGLENPLATRFWTAVKTGTSKDMRDNWCVGYSEKYTVGTWVGNFSGSPMWNVSGVSGAAPIWLEVMNYLHRRETSRPKTPPPGVVTLDVATRSLGTSRRENFVAGTESKNIERTDERVLPRILYPGKNTLMAVDPDIPTARQKIFFEAQAGRDPLRWNLNGEDLGPVGEPLLWTPHSGKYRLALMDTRRQEIDAVNFEVRGGAEE